MWERENNPLNEMWEKESVWNVALKYSIRNVQIVTILKNNSYVYPKYQKVII